MKKIVIKILEGSVDSHIVLGVLVLTVHHTQLQFFYSVHKLRKLVGSKPTYGSLSYCDNRQAYFLAHTQSLKWCKIGPRLLWQLIGSYIRAFDCTQIN